jgi:hypothetical protein
MKTRVGKIAQLPKEIRDQLNQRLENGKQGPDILKWLNDLPETKKLLAEKFDDQPINKQNLSEWRRGGYEEWLRFQERQLRIQRITEEGVCSMRQENRCDDDLFEHAGRIALAEVMADKDSLHELTREDRIKRLRTLTADLSRLQNAYTRSRWAALAWLKWNERFCGPEDYENPKPARHNPAPQARESHENQPPTPAAEDAVKPSQTTSTTGAPVTLPDYGQPIEPAVSPPLKADESPADPALKTDGEAALTAQRKEPRFWVTRIIYHRKRCGCVCHTCHPDDSEYPYAQAVQDDAEATKRGLLVFLREYTSICTVPEECQCHCEECDPAPVVSPPRPLTPIPEPKDRLEIQRLDPLADFLRQAARRKSQMHYNQNENA